MEFSVASLFLLIGEGFLAVLLAGLTRGFYNQSLVMHRKEMRLQEYVLLALRAVFFVTTFVAFLHLHLVLITPFLALFISPLVAVARFAVSTFYGVMFFLTTMTLIGALAFWYFGGRKMVITDKPHSGPSFGAIYLFYLSILNPFPGFKPAEVVVAALVHATCIGGAVLLALCVMKTTRTAGVPNVGRV